MTAAHHSIATALVECAGFAWSARPTPGGLLLTIWARWPLVVVISDAEDIDDLERRLEKILARLAH